MVNTKKLIVISFFSLIISWMTSFTLWKEFDIVINETVEVNSWIDLTIRALDDNKEPIKDYEWFIFITIEWDQWATIPYEDGYSFSKDDAWELKTQWALKFSKEWVMKILVEDFDNPEMIWEKEVKVVWVWSLEAVVESPAPVTDWTNNISENLTENNQPNELTWETINNSWPLNNNEPINDIEPSIEILPVPVDEHKSSPLVSWANIDLTNNAWTNLSWSIDSTKMWWPKTWPEMYYLIWLIFVTSLLYVLYTKKAK